MQLHRGIFSVDPSLTRPVTGPVHRGLGFPIPGRLLGKDRSSRHGQSPDLPSSHFLVHVSRASPGPQRTSYSKSPSPPAAPFRAFSRFCPPSFPVRAGLCTASPEPLTRPTHLHEHRRSIPLPSFDERSFGSLVGPLSGPLLCACRIVPTSDAVLDPRGTPLDHAAHGAVVIAASPHNGISTPEIIC